jgi:hypothetical protein
MTKRFADDPFEDDRAYRDGDLIKSGYAKARSTIQSWKERFGFPRGDPVGRTNIYFGYKLNDWHRAQRARKSA